MTKDLIKDHAEEKEDKKCKDNYKCEEPQEIESKMQVVEEQFKRLAAEFDNYRKRSLKEKIETQNIASSKIIESILPVLDDIEAAKEQNQDKGTLEIFDKLEKTLTSNGLQKFTCKDKDVDLSCCEVAFTEKGSEDNKVTKVIRTGYKLNGKILRTAIVAVSKKD